METKANPNPNGCLARALPDEPMFVLLARDPDAPFAIREWFNAREVRLGADRTDEDIGQMRQACDDAVAFEAWRLANEGKWRGAPATPIEHPSERMTSLAGKILRMGEPQSEEEARDLYGVAKSLAGALLNLDPVAGQGGD